MGVAQRSWTGQARGPAPRSLFTRAPAPVSSRPFGRNEQGPSLHPFELHVQIPDGSQSVRDPAQLLAEALAPSGQGLAEDRKGGPDPPSAYAVVKLPFSVIAKMTVPSRDSAAFVGWNE